MITLTPTRDATFLRRWMLRPAFVRKMGVNECNESLESAFQTVLEADARFFDVRVDGEEKGCIVFVKMADGWQIHTCLSTWWTATRVAIREAINQVLRPDEKIVAHYPATRTAINRLLDELGFSTGAFESGWRTREFTLNHS
jgi:hypothetical protein